MIIVLLALALLNNLWEGAMVHEIYVDGISETLPKYLDHVLAPVVSYILNTCFQTSDFHTGLLWL